MEESLPPGFRFHPTDEELITYYLARKVSDFNFVTRAITDVDLTKCEPWELPGKASMGEKEWYFFSLKDRKYPTGLRTNRATDAGYWKTTGKDKEIFHSGVIVGMKKTLVFYKGRAPKGEKSNWVMHEYRLQTKYPYKPTKEEWVVCRVFLKSSANKKPPTSPSSNLINESSCDNSMVNELGEIDMSNLSDLVSSSAGYNNGSTSNFNMDVEMNMNMNWALSANSNPPYSWPPGSMNPNILANSTILRALHLNQYQQQEAATSLNSLAMQGDNCFTARVNQASSSKIMDPIDEQQIALESVWRSC